MEKTLVKVIERRPHGDDAIDFKLQDIEADVIYELHYCHRTDNPWYSGKDAECYLGELYLDGNDLGVAYLLEVHGDYTLYFKTKE